MSKPSTVSRPAATRASARGAAEIIAHEAIVLSRYKDVAGVWTIGIGHTAAAGGLDPSVFKGTLTLEQALDLFLDDLAQYEQRVTQAFTLPLAQHEFDAAVSFDFNTGGIDRATWVETFNAGDRQTAITQIMNWKKPPQIIPRRQKEQALFATGRYASDGTAMLYPATKGGKVLWKRGKRVNILDALEARRGKDAPLAGTPGGGDTDGSLSARPGLFARIMRWFGMSA
ncbi:MAG: lysozyme [Rhizobiaceae bacterium]|nr:lysozyme [Rhizobiaceae bacterium]